ncbi:MAG: hypothetical protein A2X34_07220 [Elusimicrobia bacterium GWC2_51_8]|nr:MAG: hypothetical protein A2X33_00185 [Elusimicrobia bacterium GWA2_51_34]OGR58686.1 MAG: hypothetical protein A2X34_07220 [Elusimicrobia bacterium GWC2_51_8]OGR87734.1 MAG: hypothetical protein A2021_10050 [Elusimicrobia bacterium GWF2_52_66]HAF95864.1 hypothetical protein [Elusimicrobiota bacterium]HCE97057.1 hypothetical protein [Elusimicrobiota bacterium]
MKPDILDLTMMPALALLCAVTSFSDMREGKIRNRWILAGLVWAGVVYGALSVSRFYAPHLTEGIISNTLFRGSWFRFMQFTALNALFALVCGFLLFHFDLWSAGDAKLFFVLVLLLPLKYYFRHYLPGFPGFNLFLNTILTAAVFVWVEIVWKLARFAFASTEKNIWKEMAGAAAASLKGAVWLLLLVGTVFTLLMWGTNFFGLSKYVAVTLTALLMLALLFSGGFLSRATENRLFRLLLGAFSALLFSALLLSSLRLQFLRMALFMTAMFLVIYLLINILPGLASKYNIKIGDMPFATWLSIGLLFTILLKGSFLYLAFF